MTYTLGIDIGSTTVKIAILDEQHNILFSDYERHFANIRETLSSLLKKAYDKLGNLTVHPMITGSGGLTLANHLQVPFTQEVIAVATSLKELAPKTDVAIELGGEDAKIIYFEGGNVEQRMNGICAGGTGSFIDQMASLLQTDAPGLNEYAKNYRSLYTIAARCGVFAKTDIQPLINEGATKEDLSASIFQAVVNQTISGCGVRAVAAETDEQGVVRVTFPQVAGEPEDFARIRDIILEIMPCHLQVDFYFRFLTWEECEAAAWTWQGVEDAEHTWESFEKAVPTV